jgi:hypothetical protein
MVEPQDTPWKCSRCRSSAARIASTSETNRSTLQFAGFSGRSERPQSNWSYSTTARASAWRSIGRFEAWLPPGPPCATSKGGRGPSSGPFTRT